MISGLLKLLDVPRYIWEQTGETVTYCAVRKWAEIGEIRLLQPSDKSTHRKWTTKKLVDEFIRRHSE